jgi:ABC-type transporter Mla subunit MlaD
MVTDKEQPTIAETHGEDELTVLRRENEALAREIESRVENMARLERTLSEKDAELAGLKQSLDEAGRSLEDTGQALGRAVAAYKELVVQANPGLLAELITGDTIEAVDESLRQARALVERVRQEMEAEAARARVPLGSPQRAPLDLSGLSAREKIQYAIGSATP